MPQITAILPQKKIKGRFNIYLDGHFAVGIDEATLAKNLLKIGKHLTNDQVAKLIKETTLGRLTDQALRFLSYRQRSEKEIIDYLTRKIAQSQNIKFREALQSPQVAAVLVKLKRYNYVNDTEFAKWWIASRIQSHPAGTHLLKLELRRKGISPQIIEKVLTKVPNERKLAIRLIEKKIKKWQKLPPPKLKNKVYTFLLSRGFGWDIAREVVVFLTKKG